MNKQFLEKLKTLHKSLDNPRSDIEMCNYKQENRSETHKNEFAIVSFFGGYLWHDVENEAIATTKEQTDAPLR